MKARMKAALLVAGLGGALALAAAPAGAVRTHDQAGGGSGAWATAAGKPSPPELRLVAPLPRATPSRSAVGARGAVTVVDSPADAGYVMLPGTVSGFKYVTAVFTVPSVGTCAGPSAALHFVGLGGVNGNAYLAAIGIGEGCSSGSSSIPFYYGYWYYVFPHYYDQSFVPNFFIAPGNQVLVSVLAHAGVYTYTLNDLTTGDHFQAIFSCGPAGCASASAEVLTATYQNTNSLPVPDFGQVSFTAAKVTPTGQKGAGSILNPAWTTQQWVDYGTSVSDVVVESGPVTGTSTESAFTNTWKNAT